MHGLETIIAMNRRAPGALYQTRKQMGGNYAVTRISDGRACFYGTRRECLEWIERNGHDGDI
jgi:hypothetical protein